jgi:hypothetical protein
MAITLEAIRAAGGIVHSDGNIFFRDISMLQGLAGAAPAAVAHQGTKFFSASNEGLDEHDTAEAAQNEAQSIIDMYREEAADGWPEEVESVCWGVILGKAVERPVENAPFMAGILGSDMEPVDYVLEPVAAPALEAPAAPVGSARQFIEWMYSQPEDREPTTAEGALLEFEAHLAAAAPQAPAAPAVDVRVAIEKLPRYTYGYKSDEWGMNSHLTSYKAEDGKFLRRDDVLSAIAAQAKEGGEAC